MSDRCKAPDHALLKVVFKDTKYIENNNTGQFSCSSLSRLKTKRFNFQMTPSSFMNDKTWNDNMILLNTCFEEKEGIDTIYEQIQTCLQCEMDNKLPVLNSGRKSHSKPYWDKELQVLCQTMRRYEKRFIKCSDKIVKSIQRLEFLKARQIFDKELRTKEKRFRFKQIAEMENLSLTNSRNFWGKMKNIGPRVQSKIPLLVEIEGGVTNDINKVCSKWQTDFYRLYNYNIGDATCRNFYELICSHLSVMENEMLQDGYTQNEFLNDKVSFDEIESVTNSLKLNKSVGPDAIPNEILKFNDIKLLLYRLFQLCLDTKSVPSMWKKAIIAPIPKIKSGLNCDPLNYRGISLISTLGKAFSSFINTRIVKYCNMLDLICGEQNGFRAKRSCTDHIFVLNSIIRYRLLINQSLFVAFVDMEKCFDSINRNLLLYRLLEFNIDGNLYFCIKSMYEENKACIRLSPVINTDWFNVTTGVRQGDPLSLTLFNLFINDLIVYII